MVSGKDSSLSKKNGASENCNCKVKFFSGSVAGLLFAFDGRPIIYYLNLVNAKKTIVVSYFVVDLLAKLSHPSLPRADCSLWKHGAEHCRTVA